MEENKEKNFKPGVFLISVSLHIMLMVVFAMIQFSRGKLFQSLIGSSQTAVRALEAIEQAGIIVPNPSVKSRLGGDSGSAGGLNIGVGGIGIYGGGATGTAGQGASIGAGGSGGDDIIGAFAAGSATISGGVLGRIEDAAATEKSGRVSFFGNVASGRKVCFVVDCSGSMLGFFSQVKEKLNEVIAGLQQDNFYGIIVFQGENILEVESGKLVRASDMGKQRAFDFIESIGTPSGRPDAIEAIRRAISYTDSIGDSPAVVYFLTDGFDYDDFATDVEKYRLKYAPVVKIHTIGFMVNNRDAGMLRRIAEQSGGIFTLHSGGIN